MDLDSLQLDSAIRLITQSGDAPDAKALPPLQFVQSLIDMLCKLSSHDMLTGLANRRSYDDAIARELDRVARSGDVALLLMIDIDHFKSVNDLYGHNVGDEVLRQVASRLKDCVRPMDTVARLGGEEFSVVLPNCSHAYGSVVAERIRVAMASRRFVVTTGVSLEVTVSVGGAYAPQWIRSDATIWKERADRQLYRAKHEGRNRVCLEESIDTEVSNEEKELLFGAFDMNMTGLGANEPTDANSGI